MGYYERSETRWKRERGRERKDNGGNAEAGILRVGQERRDEL